MYDPEMGRLLGTVDEAESPRRDSIEKIREYFNGFLGGNQAVKPSFPKFDKNDVFFLSDDTAVYSGYYKFALTKEDKTKEVYAKFSYIVRKTPEYGVKIVTHNSGITPTGAVEEDSKITLADVETCVGTYAWGCAEVHGNVRMGMCRAAWKRIVLRSVSLLLRVSGREWSDCLCFRKCSLNAWLYVTR